MAWLASQSRLTQCYAYTVAMLNECGIRPNGIEIKPEILAQLHEIHPVPTRVEVDMVMSGLVNVERVKFEGTEEARMKFENHPLFRGSSLKVIK